MALMTIFIIKAQELSFVIRLLSFVLRAGDSCYGCRGCILHHSHLEAKTKPESNISSPKPPPLGTIQIEGTTLKNKLKIFVNNLRSIESGTMKPRELPRPKTFL